MEKVGNVILNDEFYKGTDLYSDGEIEDRLLAIAKECGSQEELGELLMKSDDWAVLYHLSPVRHQLLEWYKFRSDGSILEIGSGCGALTGLFCEKLGRVAAADLSKKRCLINAYRNRRYDNLEIFIGNFEDMQIKETYDYVSLIGVLEYAVHYIHSKEPYIDLLKKAKSCLKPKGTLFLAIENKYGLKYWAGASEDHTGRMFDGIQGYGRAQVRTFSKGKLEELLQQAGFCEQYFYYPVPDYKMPSEIFSEDYLPGNGSINRVSPAYDRERMDLFDEVKAFSSLCEDGLYEQFANSFLVIAQ